MPSDGQTDNYKYKIHQIIKLLWKWKFDKSNVFFCITLLFFALYIITSVRNEDLPLVSCHDNRWRSTEVRKPADRCQERPEITSFLRDQSNETLFLARYFPKLFHIFQLPDAPLDCSALRNFGKTNWKKETINAHFFTCDCFVSVYRCLPTVS